MYMSTETKWLWGLQRPSGDTVSEWGSLGVGAALMLHQPWLLGSSWLSCESLLVLFPCLEHSSPWPLLFFWSSWWSLLSLGLSVSAAASAFSDPSLFSVVLFLSKNLLVFCNNSSVYMWDGYLSLLDRRRKLDRGPVVLLTLYCPAACTVPAIKQMWSNIW